MPGESLGIFPEQFAHTFGKTVFLQQYADVQCIQDLFIEIQHPCPHQVIAGSEISAGKQSIQPFGRYGIAGKMIFQRH